MGIGRVPQIKNSPRVLSIFERKCNDEHQIKLPKMLDLKLTANSHWKFQPKMTNILFWNHFILIGHIRVKKKTLAFKTRLSAKPLQKCCENEFYLHEKRKKNHINNKNNNNNNNNNYYYYYYCEIIIIKICIAPTQLYPRRFTAHSKQ